MGFLAGECHLQPPQALAMGDNANILIFRLKDWPLFDVQLVTGVNRKCLGRLLTVIANSVKCFTNRDPRVIGPGMGVCFAELPGPDP